jgi:phospholipid/cholesterol/gamma-HCH transport system ATP-binding protein
MTGSATSRENTMNATDAARALHRAIERGLDDRPELALQLCRSATSVRFDVFDAETPVTLLLDRRPARVMLDDEPTEIDIGLSADQAVRLAQGNLPMPAALVRGELMAAGPVRRYLDVDPILQTMLAEHAGPHSSPTPAAVRTGAPRVPDPELLAIETRGLRKAFGRNQILDGVDLAIPEGVISIILGPSGTGKSVMLQHIIGLLKPDEGDVFIRGRSLAGMSRSELMNLRLEIGVMFQDGALFSAMDVFDNVAFPLREHTDLDDATIEEVAMSRLREVGLENAANRLPAQLSGGMKKRAGLARALVLDPGIVLCDEPDSGLDPVRTSLLADLLKEEHALVGGTMVIVTHNIALAKHVADHMSVLWNGRVLLSGMAEEVLASDDAFVKQFLAGEVAGPLSMD